MKYSLILCVGVGLGVPSSAEAYRLKMPWRGDSLSTSSSYMACKGTHAGNPTCVPSPTVVCPFDIGVLRWDNTLDDWSLSRVEGESMWTDKTNDPLWGMPFYSPVDGTVISCWDGMPDSDPDNCEGCTSSGNHVTIRTNDGHIVFLGHMQSGSIPPGVCPAGNRGPAMDGDSPACTDLGSPWRAIPEELLVDGTIHVRQGDLLGRGGSSGATGGNPHLHMHMRPFQFNGTGLPCFGDYERIEFDEAWAQPKIDGQLPDDADWQSLEGTPPPFDLVDFTLFWPEPSGISLDHVEVATGTKPALAVTTNGSASGGVVAFKDASGAFQAIGFGFDSDGDIVLAEEQTEVQIKAVAISRIASLSHNVVAAVRNGSDKLQLIPYRVLSNHTLDLGTAPPPSSNTISLVEVTHATSHPGIVTAVKDNLGRLKVEDFGATVVGTDLVVDARGFAISAPIVTNLDIATISSGRGVSETPPTSPFRGVVTVEQRASDNTAWVQSWSIDTSGATVAQDSSIQVKKESNNLAFAVSDVEIAVVGESASRELAVVSLRRASDNALIVQTYSVHSSGTLTRLDEWEAGPVTAIANAKVGTWDMMAGVRTSGALSLLSYSVQSNGTLGRAGTRDGAAMSEVAIGGDPAHDVMVSAVIDGSGEVSLGHFLTNYSPSV